jgi:RNA polymerase sigma factor (sigma-70 family)
VGELSVLRMPLGLHTGDMAEVARRTATSPTGDRFDDVVLPHLGAARRLARWLMRNEHDAEDAVQEASLRALRYFRTFTGGNGRAWFLRIVRNTCGAWRNRRAHEPTDAFDEERHHNTRLEADPETRLLRSDAAAVIQQAMRDMPDRLRELLVLRELKGLSYQEMADLMEIPIGTVMSSLSRARQALRTAVNRKLTSARSARRTDARNFGRALDKEVS